MSQKMLINARQPEECRIAVVEDGVLEELQVERTTNENYVHNIYKGVVVNIEQSIQAAFVDFGVGRNGFLHISDVEPHYFKQDPTFVPPRDDERLHFHVRGHDGDGADISKYVDHNGEPYAKMVEFIRSKLNLTSLVFQTVDDLVAAIGLPKEKLCTYCWTGKDVSDEEPKCACHGGAGCPMAAAAKE